MNEQNHNLMCSKCGKYFRTQTILSEHLEKNHIILRLYNCTSCDYGTTVQKELKMHIQSTHKSDNVLNCHMCAYKAIGLSNLEDHGLKSHNIIKCNRCEYWAEDEDIMNNHMKKHTGEMLFSCYVCEFEATREYLLENHREIKHKKVEVPPVRSEPDCSICEESFKYNFLVKKHKCSPKSKFACQGCTFMSVDLNELVTHAREHIKKNNIFNCDSCGFVANTEADVRSHMQTAQNILKVDLKENIETSWG